MLWALAKNRLSEAIFSESPQHILGDLMKITTDLSLLPHVSYCFGMDNKTSEHWHLKTSLRLFEILLVYPCV